MPTYAWLARFRSDFLPLNPELQTAFIAAVRQFLEDLSTEDRTIRKGLRVKGVQGANGVFEMTFAPDGRATFSYGDEVTAGEPHIVWRRVGTHDVFKRP